MDEKATSDNEHERWELPKSKPFEIPPQTIYFASNATGLRGARARHDDFVTLAPSALQLYIEKAEWFCQQEKSLTFGYDLNSQYSMRISIDRETLLYDVYRLVWIEGGPLTELWDRNEPIGVASLQIITDALQARQIRETK